MGHGRVPEKSLGGVPEVPEKVPRGSQKSPTKSLGVPSTRRSPSGVPKVPPESLRPGGRGASRVPLKVPRDPEIPSGPREGSLPSPSESPSGSRKSLPSPSGLGEWSLWPATSVNLAVSLASGSGCVTSGNLAVSLASGSGCVNGTVNSTLAVSMEQSTVHWLCQWNSQQYTGCVNGNSQQPSVRVDTARARKSAWKQPSVRVDTARARKSAWKQPSVRVDTARARKSAWKQPSVRVDTARARKSAWKQPSVRVDTVNSALAVSMEQSTVHCLPEGWGLCIDEVII